MKPELKSKTALDLAIELAQQFHHNDHGWIEAVNQVKPNWITRTDHQLSIGELVREYLDIERLIGVGFGKTTKYAVIDLDWSSQYHPAHDIDAYFKILHTLESIGLTRYVVIQSSHSRGLHIYFPLPRPIKTFELAAAIRVALIKAGFPPKNGQLEIFPNTKRYASASGDYSHYNLHRLPLQPNSGSWLMEDDGLSPQSLFDGIESQLSAFLDQWEIAAQGQDLELLTRKLPKLYATFKKSKRKYQPQSDEDKSVKAAKWEADLKLSIQIGWTERGQTYNLMPQFLAYGVVFLGLEGDELYQWMYQSIINAPGYQQHCQHQHEMSKMIRSWIKTNDRTQYYSPYKSKPDRNQNYPFGDSLLVKKASPKSNPANKRTADLAIHRIRTAYSRLIDKLTPELKIEDLKEMIQAQIKKIFNQTCSNSTLSKYKNIWHPKYRNNPNTLSQTQPNDLEDRATAEHSDSRPNLAHENLEAQTVTQRESKHPQTLMICTAAQPLPNPPIPEQSLTTVHTEHHNSDVQAESLLSLPIPEQSPTTVHIPHHNSSIQVESLLSLPIPEQPFITTYTKHYNLPAKHVVTRKPSKFEFLATALAKIISVAIVVVNAGLAAAVVTNEPANAVDIELVSPQIPTTIAPHPDAQSVEVEPQSDKSSQPLEDSTDSAHSVEIGSKLRRNEHKVGRKTYAALANCQVVSTNGLDWVVIDSDGGTWNVSHHTLASGVWEIERDAANVVGKSVRSLVEIARQMRGNLAALPDVLLSEFLQHPQLEEIQQTLELANKLASARSDVYVRDLTANLTPLAKIELWKVLSKDERIAVRQIMAGIAPVVTQESTDNSRAEDLSAPIIQHPDTPEEHQPDDVSLPQPNHLTVHPVIGGLVRTVTGAIGVVRYIFSSIPKPYVVYHENLQRTIQYELDELRPF